jgi:hypothetical protein
VFGATGSTPSGEGSIAGVIAPADRCAKVEALCRTAIAGKPAPDPRKPYVFPGQYDSKTGAFTIPNLPDGDYDLRLSVAGGTIEGADLRLEPATIDRQFDDDDRKEILGKIENYPDAFMDIQRPLYLEGNGSHAKALVELIRYRDFYSGKAGEQVWRVEIWPFDYYYGGWVIRKHGMAAIARVRTNVDMAPQAFHDLLRLFDPKVGGIAIKDGKPVSDFRYAIPEKLDMAMGKMPGSVERQAEEHRKKKAQEVTY